MRLTSLCAAAIMALFAWSTASADADGILGAEGGYIGQIRLASDLDDQRGYCIDVPGPADNLLFHIPAWAHTCHTSALPDQVFRLNEDGRGTFRFVFKAHDLCLTANAREAGSRFTYDACNAPDRQAFDVTESGEFVLRGADLCLISANMTPGGSPDEIGTGREVRATHMVRALRLRPCGHGAPEMARWIPLQR